MQVLVDISVISLLDRFVGSSETLTFDQEKSERVVGFYVGFSAYIRQKSIALSDFSSLLLIVFIAREINRK